MINCPAFPVTFLNKYDHEVNDPFGLPVPAEGGVTYPGLTKREYIAIEAMKGFIANNDYQNVGPHDVAARSAYMADLMIKELDGE